MQGGRVVGAPPNRSLNDGTPSVSDAVSGRMNFIHRGFICYVLPAWRWTDD